MRTLKRIILHCSATPDYEKESSAFNLIGASDIDVWHKHRGFKSPSGVHIGYHFVVRQSGVVEVGRPLTEIGAHAAGENSDSVGVCYVGTHRPTDAQVTSLLKIAEDLYKRFGLGAECWHGHYEYANKTCPGLPMTMFKRLVFLHLNRS